jgi:5-keto-L-gluconate epimerase
MQTSVTAAVHAGKGAPILLRGPIEESFRTASRLGYSGVELHLAHPDEVDRQEVKRLCHQYGMLVPTISTGMAASRERMSFSDPGAAVRQKAVDCIDRYIDAAAGIGSAVTIGLMYGSHGGDAAEVSSRATESEECLRQCCQYAKSKGVVIFLEAINRYEQNQNNTIDEVIERIERIGCANLKLLADTFHMNIEERDIVLSLKRSAGYLGHVHLADSNRQAPGHGHLTMSPVFQALGEIGFQGHISFEVLPIPDSVQAAQDAIAFCRNIAKERGLS